MNHLTPRRRLFPWLFAALATACGEDLVSDPSFDQWCGKELCSWQTDLGSVRQVSTWHQRDHAVELVGDEVQLSQRIDRSEECLDFRVVTNLHSGARVHLRVDFNDDGSVDYERALPNSDWQLVQFSIHAPQRYDGARFIVHKEGAGQVALAQLRVVKGDSCTGSAIALQDLSPGTPCSADSECRSNVCSAEKCGQCSVDGDCATGERCAFHYCGQCAVDADCGPGKRCAFRGERFADGRACIDVDAMLDRALLSPCDRGADCKEGVCAAPAPGGGKLCGKPCFGLAGECKADQACRPMFSEEAHGTRVCAPPAEAGELCGTAAECASETCCHNVCVEPGQSCG